MNLKEILALIPEELLTKIGNATLVDKHVKKLTGRTIFNLFLYSFIEEDKVSLRAMEHIFNNIAFQQFNGHTPSKSKHTSLSDRLKQIKTEYFEQIFTALIDNFSNVFDKEINDKIVRFDSTIITLSSKLLQVGIPVTQGPKNQIKFSVSYSALIPKQVKFQTSREHRSEDVSLKEIIKSYNFKENEIAVFDRGLQSRKSFCEFDNAGLSFVTRLGDKAQYKVVESRAKYQDYVHGNLKIEEDLIVTLQGFRAKKIDHKFRLIIAHRTDDPNAQKLFFLTNLYDLETKEIVDIYKKRWDIEVFFKFIKQHLNAKHFLSRSLNGIKVTFYMILILSILLTAYKLKNKFEGFKLVKRKFKLELRTILTREIVAFCDGNLEKFDAHIHKFIS